MTNKPNLYVFTIDNSGSMNDKISYVMKYIYDFIEDIKKEDSKAFIGLLFFELDITYCKVFSITDFIIELNETKADDNISNAILGNHKQVNKWNKKYSIQTNILITDIYDLDNEKLKLKEAYFEIIAYNLQINIIQPINFREYKRFLSTVFIIAFAAISIAFMSVYVTKNKISDFEIQIKNEFKTENYIKIENDFNVKFDVNFTVNTDNFFIPKYFFEYSMQAQNIEGEILYYPKGAYDLENPNCKCPTSVNFAKLVIEKIKTDLEKDYLKNKEIKINVTGETDAYGIKSPYIYKYEGKDTTLVFCLNGDNKKVEFKNNQLIKNNETLACLRSYSISKYLVHNLPIIEKNKKHIIYFANTNKTDKGGKYRKTKIVIIVKDYSLVYRIISIIVLIIIILGMWYLFVKHFRGTLFKNLISIKIGNIFGGND
jgi:hypothetical protein